MRGVGRLGASPTPGDESFDSDRALRDLENVVVPLAKGGTIRLAEVADVALGPGFRRGVLEKDGNEVTGGVVLMAHGENPLEVTRRIKAKIRELQTGLPRGVRIVPFYDRTPLIQGAIGTVTNTVVEAMISASLCVLLVLLARANVAHHRQHAPPGRADVVPDHGGLAAAGPGRHSGQRHVAGGHRHLDRRAGRFVGRDGRERHAPAPREQFGSQTVRGDVRDIVLQACLAVGRPIVFSVAIMVLSFLPVFALGGIEGKMFHPLAYTKTFALVAVAGSGDHARARTLHHLHSRPPAVRDGEPADPKRDRGLPAGAVVPDGPAGGPGLGAGRHVSFGAGPARQLGPFSSRPCFWRWSRRPFSRNGG